MSVKSTQHYCPENQHWYETEIFKYWQILNIEWGKVINKQTQMILKLFLIYVLLMQITYSCISGTLGRNIWPENGTSVLHCHETKYRNVECCLVIWGVWLSSISYIIWRMWDTKTRNNPFSESTFTTETCWVLSPVYFVRRLDCPVSNNLLWTGQLESNTQQRRGFLSSPPPRPDQPWNQQTVSQGIKLTNHEADH
jgi:hypothetical protein